MNPTLPPGLTSPVLILIDHTHRADPTLVARRVCYVPFFESNRGTFSMTIGEFVDDILRDIKQKPDDRIPSEKRIAQKFELLLRIVQYYSSLMEDSPAQAALLRQALEDSGFKLPGEVEMKARRPNGNGLSAHP